MFLKTTAAVIVTIAVEATGISFFSGFTKDNIPLVSIPLSQRDDWQHEFPLEPDMFASGKASWYDASRNNAWYTRDTKWGKAIGMYAAAGPDLRVLVEQISPIKINWGVTLWRKMAAKNIRPKFIITSILTKKSIVVTVTDWCGCYSGTLSDKSDDKIVDLSPAAFMALGLPLSRGVADVIIEPLR